MLFSAQGGEVRRSFCQIYKYRTVPFGGTEIADPNSPDVTVLLSVPKGTWQQQSSMKVAESILKALAEPVLVLDQSLRVVMANPAFYETLKIIPGLLDGKSVQDLIVGEIGHTHLRTVLEAVVAHDGKVDEVEVACTIPPRTRQFLTVTVRHVIFGEDATAMILVELRDITREKETERRIQKLNEALREHGVSLEAINKELESFSHSVSHDLRTPLRLMNKIAHLLLHDEGAQLSAGAIEKVQMILDSTDEMSKLIEDLLTFSQVSREPMKKRQVDLRRLAREALNELREEKKGREIEVVIDELPPCQADRALMKQVFLNLLTNSLKFTRPRERAKIHVGFTQPNGETVYFVRDNGVGFDMRHSDSIFVAFHRLYRAQHFEGSGVGLALVKRIIERHSGRVWAEGQPDQGATIYLTLGE